jgi:uncharacterized membrane protein YciS (DUF1049 family)
MFALSLVLTAVPLAVFVWLAVRCHTGFPDRVASHFDFTGTPDAYMGKKPFFILMVSLAAGLTVLFVGLAFVVKAAVLGADNPPINLINRDYWFAPERKEATAAFLAAWVCLQGAGIMWVVLDVFWQAIQINLGKAKKMKFRGLYAFLAFMALWIAIALVRFGHG